MGNSLVTYGFTEQREKRNRTPCLAICINFYLYSTLHSLQVKKIGNVTAKNYLKESLPSILCFIIQGKVSSRKGLILEFILLRMVI